jgi:lipopolysaccharide transport system ATP-binding protein
VERFIDTPVKHYSSGMYVRLAFAVAAHLEPEILIVDEVLAVGDAPFQRKCLGKMKSVATSGGRTVLFVSHNIGAVRQLTTKCIFLERGLVAQAGATAEVIDRYTRANEAAGELGHGRYCSVLDAAITDEQGHRLNEHAGAATLWLEVEVELDGLPGRSLECTLTDLEGLPLGLYSPGHFSGWRFPERRGRARFRLPLALPPLATGSYGIDVATTVHGSGPDHHVPAAVIFTVSRPPGTSMWELRKEYNAGYLILDAGDPRPVAPT